MNPTSRAYLGEFIGTFMLVFMGTAVAVLQQVFNWGPPGLIAISFAFGGTLMVLVLVIGPVSGCHLNPAVTLPMAVAGRLPWSRAAGYVVTQLAGAAAASAVLLILLRGLPGYTQATHGVAANTNAAHMSIAALFGWEVILTMLFVLTIFAATRPGVPAGPTAMAIGGFLFLAHLAGAQLGDASLNPARSFGPAIIQHGESLRVLWVFMTAPIVGGFLGMGLYRLLYSEKTG
jgi:aquaporin Z